ncbi:MAG: hypothetical protein M1818_004770 [Claussenomyces sp. TS43310]|nr:MAG: hypothetical protein M1818_004770 [Claussenomyces sp. TS43310]
MDFTPTPSAVAARHDTYDFIAPAKYAGKLKGKVVLVTGASRGIGKPIALAFAAAGASVACLARTGHEVEQLAAEIKSKYAVPALAITGNVLDDASAIVAKVESALGPIDILVNNAGIARISTIEHEEDLEKWWKVLEVNVRGPLNLIHAVTPGMIKRGSGILITTSSEVANSNVPYMSAYCASKAAITKAVTILDMELRAKGILSYAVHPGAIKTSLGASDGNEAAIKATPDLQKLMEMIPQALIDTPVLSADTMVALAADERAPALSGRFVDSTQDLGEVLDKIDQVKEDGLYEMGIKKL